MRAHVVAIVTGCRSMACLYSHLFCMVLQQQERKKGLKQVKDEKFASNKSGYVGMAEVRVQTSAVNTSLLL